MWIVNRPVAPEGQPSWWRRVRVAIDRVGRSQRFAGAVSFVGALMFAAMAFYSSDRDAHLGPDAPTAEATIVDIVHPLGERSEDVVVEFTTSGGRRVRAQTEEFMFSPYPVVGSTAVVRYDPQDPEEYVRDVRWGGDGFLTIMLASFSVVFTLGGVQGFRRRLPAWVVNWRG